MYTDILVPTDGSTGAQQALEHAVDLAAGQDATVHVVYVVNPSYTVAEGMEYLVDALEEAGKETVENAREFVADSGVPLTTAVLRGTPYREILDYVDEQDIDLIVMGTHGRTGLDRFLLGSTTEKVVRTAEVPVLTIRQRDEE